MGSIITLPASIVASCAGACAGAAVCTCCTSCCAYIGKNTKEHGSLLPYLIFVFASGILALCLRYWGQPFTVHLYIKDYALCTTDACYGYGAVFRVSFALLLFFLTHLAFNIIGGKKHGYKVDTTNWLWKILLWCGYLVVAYLIPDQFYDVYQWIARVFGGIFLVIQMILIIDFAYTWNEDWTSDRKQYYKLTLFVATCMYAVSIATCALLFVYFTNQGSGGGCTLENFFIGFTLAVTVVLSLLSISPFIDGGGLLPAGIITLYSFWLTYSALSSDPHECSNVANTSVALIVVSIIFAAISVTYAGYNVATSNSLFGGHDEEQLENAAIREKMNDGTYINDDSSGSSTGSTNYNIAAPLHESSNPTTTYGSSGASAKHIEVQEWAGASSNINNGSSGDLVQQPAAPGLVTTDHSDNQTDTSKLSRRSFRFHVFMCITALYMAMLFTNWGSREEASNIPSQRQYDLSIAAMWIKMCTEWITQLLYFWSLIASKVLSSREFTVRS